MDGAGEGLTRGWRSALGSAYHCALRTVTAFTLTWQPEQERWPGLDVR